VTGQFCDRPCVNGSFCAGLLCDGSFRNGTLCRDSSYRSYSSNLCSVSAMIRTKLLAVILVGFPCTRLAMAYRQVMASIFLYL
jgi:hypothetical protein